MNFLMIFHARFFPEPVERPQKFKCGCGRTLFRANTKEITISNDLGVGWDTYEPSQKYIELVCHSCHNMYKILFQ